MTRHRLTFADYDSDAIAVRTDTAVRTATGNQDMSRTRRWSSREARSSHDDNSCFADRSVRVRA